MSWKPEYPRAIPEARPEGHQPRAPRWSAEYAHPFTAITSDYLAIQVEHQEAPAVSEFLSLVEASTSATAPAAPQASEVLTRTTPEGLAEVIHLGYWTDPAGHAEWLATSPLGRWFARLDPVHLGFGAWHEVIEVPLERIETIYSSPDREFGLAACRGISMGTATRNGYYGAARDRLPLSSIDPLAAVGSVPRRTGAPSRGSRLRAQAGPNTAVIRSGQYWAESSGEQLEDYENELEPRMLRGMAHLTDEAELNGTLALRILRSADRTALTPKRETSVYAYFHSLSHVEKWAASHATHAAIYEHAIMMNRKHGDARTVTTWHEVFVIPESSTFEYVNCAPSTGLLPTAQQLWAVLPD